MVRIVPKLLLRTTPQIDIAYWAAVHLLIVQFLKNTLPANCFKTESYGVVIHLLPRHITCQTE